MEKTIYEQENKLWHKIEMCYLPEEKDNLVQDGLCWSDMLHSSPNEGTDYSPENIWKDMSRRVLFLAKEPNGNDGEDYRNWLWSKRNEDECYNEFGDVLSLWLKGLVEIRINQYKQISSTGHAREIFKQIPFALINIKKLPGGNSANKEEIKKWVKSTGQLIRKQIDLISPNIVVCCGSSDNDKNEYTVFNLAKTFIFPDIVKTLIKANDWCHYSNVKKMLFIDSWHPSAREENGYTREVKVKDFLDNYLDFLQRIKPCWL